MGESSQVTACILCCTSPRRRRRTPSGTLVALILASFGASGCYDPRIDGDAPGTVIPTLALRRCFSRQPTSKKAVFLDLAGYAASADATVTEWPSGSETSVSGTIKGAVARAGVELSGVRGPNDKYEFGMALGVIYASQDYDYIDGGVPAQERTGGIAPPYLINDLSVFFRVNLRDRVRLRLGGHLGGGDYVVIIEGWLAADYHLSSHAGLTVGWRYMDIHTDDGPDGSTALIFRISGPTLGLLIAF